MSIFSSLPEFCRFCPLSRNYPHFSKVERILTPSKYPWFVLVLIDPSQIFVVLRFRADAKFHALCRSKGCNAVLVEIFTEDILSYWYSRLLRRVYAVIKIYIHILVCNLIQLLLIQHKCFQDINICVLSKYQC